MKQTLQKLFKREANWCKKAVARTKLQDPADPEGPYARSWCVMGAIDLCYHKTEDKMQALDKLKAAICSYTGMTYRNGIVADWNDSPKTSIEDVRNVVKLANI
jgi:hypothetical protein